MTEPPPPEDTLARLEARLRVLEALALVHEHRSEIVELVAEAPDIPAAQQALADRFSLSQEQAQAMIDTRFNHLTRSRRERVQAEREQLEGWRRELEQS